MRSNQSHFDTTNILPVEALLYIYEYWFFMHEWDIVHGAYFDTTHTLGGVETQAIVLHNVFIEIVDNGAIQLLWRVIYGACVRE